MVLAYGTGTAAAALDAGAFDWLRALLGYACVAFIQFASVLTNEHFDYPDDMLRRKAGPFSGGSRVIVTGALTQDDVLRGIAVSVALLGAASGLLLAVLPHELRIAVLVMVAAGAILGLGHSAPPLGLSRRGFGEINIAFTHATFPLLFGWAIQGGSRADPLPVLVSMPAFWALFSARTIAGLPDARAMASARRRSYAVIFGPAPAAGLAAFGAAAASAAGILLWRDQIVSGWLGAAFLLMIPTAGVLIKALVSFMRSPGHDRDIDGALLVAFVLTLCAGLIPFAYFVRLALR